MKMCAEFYVGQAGSVYMANSKLARLQLSDRQWLICRKIHQQGDHEQERSQLTCLVEQVILRHSDNVLVERMGIHHLGLELVDGACTEETHVHLELVSEDLDCALDALLAVRAERVEERAADTDSLRAERDRLEHIARAANTTVDEDLEVGVRVVALRPEGGDDLDEDLETRARGVELTTTVVGEDDTLDTGLVSQDRILRCRDTLENDGHC